MTGTSLGIGLTGNQLKLIAALTMTVDHIGLIFLPKLLWLRVIGRLAMPIFAYMIAEGCRHTGDRKRYFLRLFLMALLCQAVYCAVDRTLYQSILVTFSLSILMIFAIDRAKSQRSPCAVLTALLLFVCIFLVCEILPEFLSGFYVDYGFWGVMLPVIVYLGANRLWAFALGTAALCLSIGSIQWWSVLCIPLMALYTGKRGNLRLGRAFYLYYPTHLALLYAVDYII